MKNLLKNLPYGNLVIAILLGVGISQIPNCPQWAMPLYIVIATIGLVGGTMRNLKGRYKYEKPR